MTRMPRTPPTSSRPPWPRSRWLAATELYNSSWVRSAKLTKRSGACGNAPTRSPARTWTSWPG
jgi:hypothetical protein